MAEDVAREQARQGYVRTDWNLSDVRARFKSKGKRLVAAIQPFLARPEGDGKSSGVVDLSGGPVLAQLPSGETASVLGYVVSHDDGGLEVMVREEEGFDRDELLAAIDAAPTQPSTENSGGVGLNRSLVSRLVDSVLILLCNGWEAGPLSDLQDRHPEIDDRVQSLFDRKLIENRRDPCDDVETYATSDGFDAIREAVLAAALTQPVSPQPQLSDEDRKELEKIAFFCDFMVEVAWEQEEPRAAEKREQFAAFLRKLASQQPVLDQQVTPELDEQLAEERVRYDGLREIVDEAIPVIDRLFEFFATSGLSEEGGGLALHEATKPLADIRARLAEATQSHQHSQEEGQGEADRRPMVEQRADEETRRVVVHVEPDRVEEVLDAVAPIVAKEPRPRLSVVADSTQPQQPDCETCRNKRWIEMQPSTNPRPCPDCSEKQPGQQHGDVEEDAEPEEVWEKVEGADLREGDTIRMWLFTNNDDGYKWCRAEVLTIGEDTVDVRFSDGELSTRRLPAIAGRTQRLVTQHHVPTKGQEGR